MYNINHYPNTKGGKEIKKGMFVENQSKPAKEVIVIDTETTGVTENDELLQVAIINGEGKELFVSYVRPTKADRWDGAMKVNGITPLMVSNSPTIEELKDEIQRIVDSCDVIAGYNVGFDLGFLERAGISTEGKEIVDVMKMAGSYYEPKWGKNRWYKLTDAAAKHGFDYNERKAHDALTDCLATLHVWKKIKAEDI